MTMKSQQQQPSCNNGSGYDHIIDMNTCTKDDVSVIHLNEDLISCRWFTSLFLTILCWVSVITLICLDKVVFIIIPAVFIIASCLITQCGFNRIYMSNNNDPFKYLHDRLNSPNYLIVHTNYNHKEYIYSVQS
eukprot:164305_1